MAKFTEKQKVILKSDKTLMLPDKYEVVSSIEQEYEIKSEDGKILVVKENEIESYRDWILNRLNEL